MLPAKMVLLMGLSTVALLTAKTEACNEAVCASVVSKCQLTESCKCTLKNPTCSHECFTCLGNLYDECCSCVDMCPKRKTSDSLSTKSHVKDFLDPIPELFMSLMAEPDSVGRWHVVQFQDEVKIDPMYSPKYGQEIKLRTTMEQEVAPRKDTISINCTVAFMSDCTSWFKCEHSCQATGASKYRWFHDGCCECVGHGCVSYGSDKSQCRNCPKDDKLINEDNSAYYYDDEMDFTLGGNSNKHQSTTG